MSTVTRRSCFALLSKDLVGTGDMPSRLILGADSFGAITGELDARKAEYEKWKDTSFSTYLE